MFLYVISVEIIIFHLLSYGENTLIPFLHSLGVQNEPKSKPLILKLINLHHLTCQSLYQLQIWKIAGNIKSIECLKPLFSVSVLNIYPAILRIGQKGIQYTKLSAIPIHCKFDIFLCLGTLWSALVTRDESKNIV